MQSKDKIWKCWDLNKRISEFRVSYYLQAKLPGEFLENGQHIPGEQEGEYSGIPVFLKNMELPPNSWEPVPQKYATKCYDVLLV